MLGVPLLGFCFGGVLLDLGASFPCTLEGQTTLLCFHAGQIQDYAVRDRQVDMPQTVTDVCACTMAVAAGTTSTVSTQQGLTAK